MHTFKVGGSAELHPVCNLHACSKCIVNMHANRTGVCLHSSILESMCKRYTQVVWPACQRHRVPVNMRSRPMQKTLYFFAFFAGERLVSLSLLPEFRLLFKPPGFVVGAGRLKRLPR